MIIDQPSLTNRAAAPAGMTGKAASVSVGPGVYIVEAYVQAGNAADLFLYEVTIDGVRSQLPIAATVTPTQGVTTRLRIVTSTAVTFDVSAIANPTAAGVTAITATRIF